MVMNNTFGMLPLLLVAALTHEAPAWGRLLARTPWDGWLWLGNAFGGCWGFRALGFGGCRV